MLLQDYFKQALNREITEVSKQLSNSTKAVLQSIAEIELIPNILYWLLVLSIDSDTKKVVLAVTSLDNRKAEDTIEQDLFIT